MDRKVEAFKPDYSKQTFEVVIKAYSNCSSVEIKPVEGHKLDFYQVLGVLESAKASVIEKQKVANRESLLQHNEKKVFSGQDEGEFQSQWSEKSNSL